MKILYATMIISLLSLQIEAAAVNLDEAVNQVKTEGRVLSAKTINNKHEIKVLTPSGTVKTYNMDATPKGPNKVEPKRPNNNAPDQLVRQHNGSQMDNRQIDLRPEPENNKIVKRKKDK